MRKAKQGRTHTPSLFSRLIDAWRGREQILVRGSDRWPLLLVSYPAQAQEAAEELRDAWLHTLPVLQTSVVHPYREMLEQLPVMVVVLLRRRNVCTCLGHHHPKGTESRLTRRLASDIGTELGEIDLAWEAIDEWQPQPLSALAVTGDPLSFAKLRFRTALLTVLLHELEHLAFPDRAESAVRHSSDEFYTKVLSELLQEEGVAGFGMVS